MSKLFNIMRNKKLFMDFTDENLEKHFLEKQHEENISYNKFALIIGFLLISGFYFIHIFLNPPGQIYYILISYTIIVLSFLFTFIVVFSKYSYKLTQHTLFFLLLIIDISSMLATVSYDSISMAMFNSGLLILILAGFTFLRVSFSFAMPLAILLIISYFIIIFLSDLSILNIVLYLFLFLCSIFIGMSVNYGMEKRERHNFLKLLIIVEDRLKLSNLEDTNES